jgi:hypothetical protein
MVLGLTLLWILPELGIPFLFLGGSFLVVAMLI